METFEDCLNIIGKEVYGASTDFYKVIKNKIDDDDDFSLLDKAVELYVDTRLWNDVKSRAISALSLNVNDLKKEVNQYKQLSEDLHKQLETIGLQMRDQIVVEYEKQFIDHLKQTNSELREAIQLFVDRVDKGEIRSTKTYNQFKSLLAKTQ